MLISLCKRALVLGMLFPIAGSASGQQTRRTNVNSSLTGIDKLHQQDVGATVSRDLLQLVALLADDGVVIGQGESLVSVEPTTPYHSH